MKYIKPTIPINFKDVIEWYKNIAVQFEMIKSTKFRETGMLVPSYQTKEFKHYNIRMLKCHSVQHLSFLIRSLKMFEKEKNYNFYYTLAEYDGGIPNQSMDLYQRDNSSWNQDHHKYMTSFDFMLDIDAGSFDDMQWAYHSANTLRIALNRFNVPYELRFSGKGFHFIIPYRYFSKLGKNFIPHDDNSIYKLYGKLAQYMYETYSEMIDTKIYDARRLCKVPYSLSLYENDIFVCHPFHSEDEFLKFEMDDYRPDKYNVGLIRGRGLYLFNADGDADKLLRFLEIIK